MARRATAIFRATPAAGRARRVAGKLDRAARALRSTLIAELRESEDELLRVFRFAAPYDQDERDDVHLIDELDARIATAGQIRLTIHSPVRDPNSNYAYTDVTRFGHRGVLRAKGPGPMRWKDGSGWHSAYETAGHHPPSDWVEDARPEAEEVVADAADHLGRVIYTRLLA